MRLAEFAPWFVRHGVNARGHVVLQHVSTSIDDAQGLLFDCPKCRDHAILVWFIDRGVPENAEPTPRWATSGATIDDLTIVPSIQIPTGCGWHGFIRAGDVVNA